MLKIKCSNFFIVILLLLSFASNTGISQTVITHDDKNELVGKNAYFLEEKGKPLSISEVIGNPAFQPANTQIINLGLSNSYFWIKVDILNQTASDILMLNIDQPTLNYVEAYQQDSTGKYYSSLLTGNNYPFSQREFKTPNYAFNIHAPRNKPTSFYLRIKGNSPLVIPIFVGKKETISDDIRQKNILFGIYAGIIVCMLLYNLFLMFSIRDDKSYIWYVLHTLFVGLTQASFFGYTFQYLWPNNGWLAQQSIFIFTCLVSIVGIIFLQVFLSTRSTIPRLNKVFFAFFLMYLIIMSMSLSGQYVQAYKILQPTQGMVALFILFISGKLVKDGQKQARFYLLSWFLLMAGIIIFALKDFNLIPYNNFTSTIMLSGSATQVILLSFALGDKINILQENTIKATRETARIISEQNVVLEAKVAERTIELKESNDGLSKALTDLKEAESQLVESEKMASLGQLTAGIAHEINNPINFVTSNVKPLKRDVEMLLDVVETLEKVTFSDASMADKQKQIDEYKADIDFDYLKTEIDHLLNGINDGASRTAEIVKGLRIFSRLDEDDLKRADINEGIDSTLIIVNNLLNNRIEIVKNYGQIPPVECYPGKLNQVFLNMITNAIYAINKRHGEQPGGKLTITTTNDEENVTIKIADNGTGMDESTKKKLFEPFFTTKDVGEGTGLGLSIAYNTINKHNGRITVNSAVGEGTEFIIEIPMKH